MPTSKFKATFVEPMLCVPASSLPQGPDCEYELKLDGYRAIAFKAGMPILYAVCTSVLKYIVLAAAVGFFVPILWMILGFVTFNGRNGMFADLYYLGALLVCPLSPITSSHFGLGPPINACVYGFGTWVFLSLRHPKNTDGIKAKATNANVRA